MGKQLRSLRVLNATQRDRSRYLVSDADEARLLLGELNIRLYDHKILADRIWELRDNMSAYDASRVALADASGLELLTTDTRLANAPGHNARITLIS